MAIGALRYTLTSLDMFLASVSLVPDRDSFDWSNRKIKRIRKISHPEHKMSEHRSPRCMSTISPSNPVPQEMTNWLSNVSMVSTLVYAPPSKRQFRVHCEEVARDRQGAPSRKVW